MKIQTISLQSFSNEYSLRQDFDYHLYQFSHSSNYYTFTDLFEFVSDSAISVDDLYIDFDYCEIGLTSKDGNVFPVSLNFERRNLVDENYYKKIEKGDIISVQYNDILISKVRPNLKKYIRITDRNKNIYFTSAFLHIRAKYAPEVLYYSIRSIFYNDLIAISRQGKGYPTLNERDLYNLRFDKTIVDNIITKSNIITPKILEIEHQIETLKQSIKPTKDIIDDILAAEFEINRLILYDIAQSKTHTTTLPLLLYNNSNLRFSARWNKAVEIQEALTQMTECMTLGNYIIDTKNGWSPDCSENATTYQVLSLDSINESGYIDFERVKFSDQFKNNINDYYIHNGDFFASRGNGSDNRVAMASVAILPDDSAKIVYPDIMIKVKFDACIDTTYMAYIFNSFIGRLYFSYASKGSNMKKVTSKELSNFMLPIPEKKMQRLIVNKIKSEIAKQDAIREKSTNLHLQIYSLIEDTICNKNNDTNH